MPLSALMLVLVAALLHASWNLAAKVAGGDARFSLLGRLLGERHCGLRLPGAACRACGVMGLGSALAWG